jgi:hypothetical protein
MEGKEEIPQKFLILIFLGWVVHIITSPGIIGVSVICISRMGLRMSKGPNGAVAYDLSVLCIGI